MSGLTLAVGMGFSFLTAVVIGYVAWALSRREVPVEGRFAFNLFVLWWAMLAIVTLAGGMTNAIAIAGFHNVPALFAVLQMLVVGLVVGLWGLLYYLVYVYTGSRRAIWPITAFYIVFLTYVFYALNVRDPIGVRETTWSVGLEYANEFSSVANAALIVGLVGPQAIAALGYASLLFQVETATQKWRIGLVSGAIFVWFSLSTWAGVFRISQQYWWWPLVSRSVTLVAALVILAAFNPPGWARNKWGIEPVAKKRGRVAT